MEMDNLLPHSRVIAYLSRYSLRPSIPRKFYVIVSQSSDAKDKLVKIASAFGCTGIIFVGQGNDEAAEQKDDEREVYHVATMEEARRLARENLSCDVVGVLPTALVNGGHRRSTSLSHPKAFSRTTAFCFVGNNDGFEGMCDRLIHVSSGSMVDSIGLGVEACASIVFHHFVEMRTEMLNQVFEPIRGEVEPVSMI